MNEPVFYTYVLLCRDGTFYTGWTCDMEARLRAHNEGRGAKYTRGRRPVRPVRVETFATRSDAMRREREIKLMTRTEKARLTRAAYLSHDRPL
ncbi:MAG: GIY-YIG nuclease family protein [Synergistaceae bacterium]|nr:GIY-YIG nuclease family protein [Synergistaceae bacterium]